VGPSARRSSSYFDDVNGEVNVYASEDVAIGQADVTLWHEYCHNVRAIWIEFRQVRDSFQKTTVAADAN